MGGEPTGLSAHIFAARAEQSVSLKSVLCETAELHGSMRPVGVSETLFPSFETLSHNV